MAVISYNSPELSMSSIFNNASPDIWIKNTPSLILIALSLLIIVLVENSRLPFDDPNTHLELTMIHEVMVLDYSGPDLGIIFYNASLKLWILGSIMTNLLLLPLLTKNLFLDLLVFLFLICLLAFIIGVIESVMVRLRLISVPKLLIGASVFSLVALILLSRT